MAPMAQLKKLFFQPQNLSYSLPYQNVNLMNTYFSSHIFDFRPRMILKLMLLESFDSKESKTHILEWVRSLKRFFGRENGTNSSTQKVFFFQPQNLSCGIPYQIVNFMKTYFFSHIFHFTNRMSLKLMLLKSVDSKESKTHRLECKVIWRLKLNICEEK